MRYPEAIANLFSLESRGIRMGVDRMTDALRFRGCPDRGIPLIHVAGTNGKGSVATMVAHCLKRAGYKTGLFTSPHLHRYVERVRVGGRPLSEREAARRIGELLSAFGSPQAPDTTFFELTTLLAIESFRDHDCDVAVLEVGLGGRLDATNATEAVLSVITSVALDHTNILGDTIGAIAREKAGILRPGVPAVVGARDPTARRVVRERARRLGCELDLIGRDFEVIEAGGGGFSVRGRGGTTAPLTTGLAGAHQRDNAAVAVAALDRLADVGLPVSAVALRAGLRTARWPGRMEVVAGAPDILFDCAHNVGGSAALAAHLDALDRPAAGRRVLLFGAMADKAIRPMLRMLGPRFDRVIYIPPTLPRAATASALTRAYPGHIARSMKDALARARRRATGAGLVVVAGSIFTVAEARSQVLGVRTDPLIRL